MRLNVEISKGILTLKLRRLLNQVKMQVLRMRQLALLFIILFSGRLILANDSDKLWDQVYDERTKFVEENIGTLPEDILKIVHLSGTWPGGGLYKFKADKLGDNYWAYMTFGLTNPDMPTKVVPSNVNVEQDESNRPEKTSLTLESKQNVPSYPDRIGYGYELLVITEGEKDWPLWFLQWAVQAELLNDADILGRVEQYKGLTVEDINIGGDGFVNMLFQKALSPFPSKIELGGKTARIIIATAISDDEMEWSKSNGRDNLLTELSKSKVHQISHLKRESIFYPKGIEYSEVNSREMAETMFEKGLLRKAYLFPIDFGGQEVAENVIYLTKDALIKKMQFESKVLELGQNGLIENYSAKPEYVGDSFVPKRLKLEATGKESTNTVIDVF